MIGAGRSTTLTLCIVLHLNPVANPGFPRGGAANSPGGGGAPTYDFAKISQKLHEMERIWTPGASLAPPLDPPFQSEDEISQTEMKHS